jgi:anaerobic magnesium-protoporphyrin IX monomethyl ester cyclase
LRVLLIALPQDGHIYPPLNLLYLAGTLWEHNIEYKVIDESIVGSKRVADEIDKGYDIIGMSVLTYKRWDAFWWSQYIRCYHPDTTIVMGGVHATIMPEQCRKYADYVVTGDGEGPLLDICQGKEPIPRILPIDSLRPDWDAIDFSNYKGKGFTQHDRRKANGVDIRNEVRVPMIVSRSCTSHCRFCSSFWVQGPYRMRTPRLVVDEMEWIVENKGTHHVYFVDDSFYLDKSKCLEFCGEIVSRKLKVAFRIQTRADVLDKEYVEALKEAGCYYVAIGVETGSGLIMGKLHKSTDVNAAEIAIANCKRAGIRTEALMIIGNEGETDETIEETRRFLKRTKPTTIGSGSEGLWIFPGTAVYQSALKEGLITPDFWDSRERAKTYKFTKEQIAKWYRRIYTYNLLSALRYWFKRLEEYANRRG